jgi:glycosyltransferase involved in cell wall biosynthesis
MKKLFKLLSFFFCVLLLFAAIGKTIHLNRADKKASSRSDVKKSFVVIIPSYNNASFCERNLRSVFEQKYENYRVIYIDDASTDETYEMVKRFIAESSQENRVTLIQNPTNRGALANLYLAIHSCKDEEIIVTLDGDDFFAHEWVLSKLNKTYAKPDVWMTYGNFVDYPSYTQKPVMCKKIPFYVLMSNGFRKAEWVTSHLRTFYAGLFKKIPLQHLLYKGRFFPMAWDLPLMLPMLEMSGKHAYFIRDVLYLYNRSNPINDHKVNIKLQRACTEYTRGLSPYARLQSLDLVQRKCESVDLIVFSPNCPHQLENFVDSVMTYVSPLPRISIVYEPKNREADESYDALKVKYPSIGFYRRSEQAEDFRSLLFEILETESSYVAFATDEVLIHDRIDFNASAEALEKTGAHGFYFTCGSESLPSFIPLGNEINAWQFKTAPLPWKQSNHFDMVLYSRETLKRELSRLKFDSYRTLREKWAQQTKKRRIGLFHDHPRATSHQKT